MRKVFVGIFSTLVVAHGFDDVQDGEAGALFQSTTVALALNSDGAFVQLVDGATDHRDGERDAAELTSNGTGRGSGYRPGIAPWDQFSIVGEDGGHQCHWLSLPFASMCVREYSDAVSDAVKRDGRWGDCDALEVWWKKLPDRSAESPTSDFVSQGASSNKLFVDIGSNIGSCLFPMAARSDVPMAVAFEPNPKNLFYLTSSVLATPQTKSHIVVYPFALGDEDSNQNIYMEPGNAGNTVLGVAIAADATPVDAVSVVRLDEVFMAGSAPPYIHLMKIDAQGFEVKILKGAAKLFASGAVNAVKFELASVWLEGQGTSAAEYCNAYLSFGFEIFNPSDMTKLDDAQLREVACGAPSVQDFIAVHTKPGATVTQQPVRC